jgi:peptidoglycan hydrolase-like protein with peptidoglycan-binding domain
MALTLAELRDNLDGLGYYLGPRGAFGLGNRNESCDRSILGNIDCSSTALRDLSILDAYTQSAIFQFQLDNNLAATGRNGADLQAKLEEAVRIVQNNLKIVLNISLPITGKYLFQTIDAIKIFQRNRTLPVTGIASRPVRKQLDDDARRILGKPPSSTPFPTPTPSSELDSLRKLKAELASLKVALQERRMTEAEFIREVFDRIS